MPRTRCYRAGTLCAKDFPLNDVSEHLQDASAVVWVDLGAPDLADLQLVADELGLHTLAVEDATTGRQRPKFNRYSGHDFLTAYAVHLDLVSGELITGRDRRVHHVLCTGYGSERRRVPHRRTAWSVGRQCGPDEVRRRRPRPWSARLRG
jgi:Mg2+ and Co2+ transporter CorA